MSRTKSTTGMPRLLSTFSHCVLILLSIILFTNTFLLHVTAQAPPANGGNTAGCTPENNATGGCADRTAVTGCVTGDLPGAFFITSPTALTLASVSNQLNISWSFSDATNRQRFPARRIDIYYASITKLGETWPWQPAVENITATATSTLWSVPNLGDGLYQVRIVADDTDPARALAQKQQVPCIPEGFPVPGLSNKFRVINPVSIIANKDEFPPNSGALGLRWGTEGLVTAAALAAGFVVRRALM
ncbi:hypothetical protein HK102_001685 [Quaeritorhiza haematococci]|nr:hypothetical protein HK102_001685 [Quaeritorhiza haematococci]